MKNLNATALRYENGVLKVLDQRRLPAEEHWHVCKDDKDLVALIQGLAIRGAPLIGIAAALWVGHCADRGHQRATLTETITLLRASRPTAVNLMNYLDRMQTFYDRRPHRAFVRLEGIDRENIVAASARMRHVVGTAADLLVGPGIDHTER